MEKNLRRSERISSLKSMKQKTSMPSSSETLCEKKKRKKFVCEKCSSTTSRDTSRGTKCTKSHSKPKICYDPESDSMIKVCVPCAKMLSPKISSKTLSPNMMSPNMMSPNMLSPNSQNDKNCSKNTSNRLQEVDKYLAGGHSFALSLVQLLNDQDAERLYCPYYKKHHPCACLQKFVVGNSDNLDDTHSRAKYLLDLLKRAKLLSQQKCYANKQKLEKVGLGNGQKKSKEFEEFVLEKRNQLKVKYNFCERASQRVLLYSNNFLHKKLKTEKSNGRRIGRQKGAAALGKLIDMKLLVNQFCCGNKCVKMASTHENLLVDWRQRAAFGQAEARRVLAEMLIPTQANRTNCYKFISMVTGSSHKTISSVNERLRRTGGIKEPLEHGLKKFWQEVARKQHQVNEQIAQRDSVSVINSNHGTSEQIIHLNETQLNVEKRKQHQVNEQIVQRDSVSVISNNRGTAEQIIHLNETQLNFEKSISNNLITEQNQLNKKQSSSCDNRIRLILINQSDQYLISDDKSLYSNNESIPTLTIIQPHIKSTDKINSIEIPININADSINISADSINSFQTL